jgi:hypothetical protein
MEREMKEFSSNPKIKTLKLVPVLLMATFLQVGTAHSEGRFSGGLGGALGGLGGALGGGGSGIGGALGGVGNTVGGLTGGLGNTAKSATNGINAPTTKFGTVSLNPDDQVGANANSQLINGINAKARALNPDQLASLCMAAGGGDSGCGSGSTTEVRATLNANLQNLSSGQLASLCAGVGCSTSSAANPIGSNPSGSNPSGSRGLGGANGLGGMSRGEVVAYKKRCMSVLRSPQRYESDIVSLCRLIKRARV